MSKETKAFQTEVRQLLDLVIHSLYSKKEIFLRELISNASDAIDRARFESLTRPDFQPGGGAWTIRLAADKEAKTLTVSDNGIGMSAEELDQNLGTIASSGTRRYLDALRAAKTEKPEKAAPELIGQFGVGFYSAFMAATRVTVVTRRAGTDQAFRWESDGSGSYTVEPGERDGQGTDVTLHLRDGMESFLEEWHLRETVRHYSDFIEFPIVFQDKTLNSRKAIWRKARPEVTEDEYREFYRHVSHDHADPLKTIHYAAEGTSEFRALLYIPAKAPADLWMPAAGRPTGIHLYVRNVFITDACRELTPPHLRFLRGVVDSSDLPLNVSREMLQDDAMIRRIRKSVSGKTLNTLLEMKEKEPAVYGAFYKEFGAVLKEGLHADPENRDKLLDLLLFASTASDEPVDLKAAVGRLKNNQKALYYLVADSEAAARQSPLLEGFRARGLEVLLLTDPVDAWIEPALDKYGEHPFQPIHRGAVEWPEGLDAEETAEKREARREAGAKAGDLTKALKEALGDAVKEVRVSERLTDSACCLVSDEGDMTPEMERLLKAMRQEAPELRRILEVNPLHPAVAALEAVRARDAKDPRFADGAELLLGQALLAEGGAPRDPARYARLVADLMARAAG